MHLQRNWVLAFVAIAGCAMFVFAFTSFAQDSSREAYTDKPASSTTEKAPVASSPNSEMMPDIAGEWRVNDRVSVKQYKIVRSESNPIDFDVYHVSPSKADKLGWRLQWNPTLKAFRATKADNLESIGVPFTATFTATVEDDAMTMRSKVTLDEKSIERVAKKHDQFNADTMVKELAQEWVWKRQPTKEVAQVAGAGPVRDESIPKIAGDWVMEGMRGSLTIFGRTDDTVYDVYDDATIREQAKPFPVTWDPNKRAFAGTRTPQNGGTFDGTITVIVKAEDNPNVLLMQLTPDDVAKKSLDALNITKEELDLLLNLKLTRSAEKPKPAAKTPLTAIIATEQPAAQKAIPDIAGEWIQKDGTSVGRFKIVQKKPKLAHAEVYEMNSSKPDKLVWRFQWNSNSNAFVGKISSDQEEPLNMAMRMLINATVEDDGTTMRIKTSLDPESFDRIMKKHGEEAANDMLNQLDHELVWDREPATAIAQAPAAESPVPAIGGTWLMGDQGSFGKSGIVRSAEPGCAFDVYYYKPVKDTAQPALVGPTYRLKWDPNAKVFESSTGIAINSKLPGTAFVKITVEENGTALRVKMIPDEEGVKTLEAIKQRGPSQKRAIEQWIDMKWTREKESPQGPYLTDDLLNALSQAKSPAGFVSGGQGGFGGGQFGGEGYPGTAIAPVAGIGGRIVNEVERYRDRIESKDLLLIETGEGLSAYSKSLGKWSALKVGLPKNGKNRLSKTAASDTFVSVIIDDQLYGYSSQAGAWDQISIPQEFQTKVKPAHGVNVLLATIGNRTYALSSKTGKWTASDQPVPPAASSTTNSDLAVQDIRVKLGANVTPQDLTTSIVEHEASASHTAKEIRKILEDPAASKDAPEVQKLQAELKNILTKTFDLKTQLETSRVQDLQSRLKRLEQQLGRRQTQRTKIIDRHLQDLIEGEDTDWTTEATNEGNPQPAQTGGGFF